MNARWIATIVAIVLAAAAAGWWVYDVTLAETATAEVDVASDDGEASSVLRADAPPIYLALEPPFLVNFEADGTLRFLQVSVAVMTRSEAVIAAVEQHMPHVRNNLLLILGNQTLETVATRQAKEALRTELLEELRAVLTALGAPAGVEALYFTAFVMQ